MPVSSSAKNKGVAKMMNDFYEQQLKLKGEKAYGLSVRKSNKKAINFYLKNGFTTECEHLNSISLYKIIN